jgi:hypothetical protein
LIEKALIVIIFMYSTSFGILAAQFLWADMVGIELVNADNVGLGPSIETILDIDQINTSTSGIVNLNQTGVTQDPISTAANLTWDILQLLTGTYIFNVLALLGIPAIVIAGLVIIYTMLLFRALIGYLRGI